MKIKSLTPTRLRLLLMAALVLIPLLTIGTFYLAYQRLDKIAADVKQTVARANDSQDSLQQLQKLKNDLEAEKGVVEKTSLIAADSQNYNYQDQIVSDITAYAAQSGMTISNINFLSNSTGSVASPAQSSPADASPAGLRKTTVGVALKNPVDYEGLLNFLHYIEQSLTKFKVVKVYLTKGENNPVTKKGTVTTEVLNLEVYLR